MLECACLKNPKTFDGDWFGYVDATGVNTNDHYSDNTLNLLAQLYHAGYLPKPPIISINYYSKAI